MPVFNPFRRRDKIDKKIEKAEVIPIGNIYVPTDSFLQNRITEAFKGEIEQKDVKFPTDLGEAHPFDFSVCEGVYKQFGFVTGVIDKYVDFILGGGMYVTSDNENAQTIIENFMRDVSFDALLRPWIKEALMKGNGFMEIGGVRNKSPMGLKVLNANHMYVKRDNKGEILNYNQYTGGFKRFNKSQVIPFDPHEIGHLAFNKIGDSAYGYGIIYSGLPYINNLLQNSKDLHILMNRKANAPIHAKLGDHKANPPIKASKSDVTSFGKKLEYLHNKHEWATDDLVELKVIDFGNIGEKFDTVLKFDTDMLFFTFQVPEVLMGRGNIAEGLAEVQMDTFMKNIKSKQEAIEKIVEEQIFRRVLNANGFDEHVEIHWGQPSDKEKNERIERLTQLLNSKVIISPILQKEVEKDLAIQLGYGELVETPEEEREREEKRPQPVVPKETYVKESYTPPIKTISTKEKLVKPLQHAHKHTHEDYYQRYGDKDFTLKEWLGFDYEDYLDAIDGYIDEMDFDFLIAATPAQIEAGYLTQTQINSLKGVMKEGFKKGYSTGKMSKLISERVKPKDLYRMKGGKLLLDKDGNKILKFSSNKRAINIARTEASRMANGGLLKDYKNKKVKKVSWVAAVSARTCPACIDLDGQIFTIEEAGVMMPLHPMCRCTWNPVTGLG